MDLDTTVRDYPSKTSGRKGGGSNVDDLRRWGSGEGRLPTGRPKMNLFLRFRSSYWKLTPPPLSCLRASGSIYILHFGRFYTRYNPDVRDRGGVGVCQTDDVGQWGVQKVTF